jgi:hypothetical protein
MNAFENIESAADGLTLTLGCPRGPARMSWCGVVDA